MYMVSTMTALLAAERFGVMPVERPTVPNADTVSNSSFINSVCGSSTHSKNVEVHTTPEASKVMTNALRTISDERVRLNAAQGLLVDADKTACINTKKVVVLIPPPVDPGDAPINISTHSVSKPAFEKVPMG